MRAPTVPSWQSLRQALARGFPELLERYEELAFSPQASRPGNNPTIAVCRRAPAPTGRATHTAIPTAIGMDGEVGGAGRCSGARAGYTPLNSWWGWYV